MKLIMKILLTAVILACLIWVPRVILLVSFLVLLVGILASIIIEGLFW